MYTLYGYKEKGYNVEKAENCMKVKESEESASTRQKLFIHKNFLEKRKAGMFLLMAFDYLIFFYYGVTEAN
jgi:hypothetical protein